jgi:hypothetical protein
MLLEWLFERRKPGPVGRVDGPPERWTGHAGLYRELLALAYAAAPRPDLSNIGLWGTPINHPFRFTDNINRMQAFFLVILAPGRLVSAGLVDLVFLLRAGRID